MSDMDNRPSVVNVQRHRGIAGQYSVSATVAYPGEKSQTVTFVTSTYGGPVVMVTPSGVQTMVSAAVLDRIGRTVDAEWVREFFA